jgi:hypothetical protein
MLGPGHRGAGVVKQRLAAAAVARIECDTEAGGEEELSLCEPTGLGQCAEQLAGEPGDGLHVVGVGHDDELVAIVARQRDVARRHRGKASRRLLQQVVARCVPQAVVDGLEPVEIDQDDGEERTALAAARDPLGDAIGQEVAVRQARERVEVGFVLDLGDIALALADIAKGGDRADQHAVLEHGLAGQLDLPKGAVLVPETVLAAVDRMAAAQAGAERTGIGCLRADVQSGEMEGCMGISADQRLARITEHGCGGWIDEDDVAVRVGSADAFAGAQEDLLALVAATRHFGFESDVLVAQSVACLFEIEVGADPREHDGGFQGLGDVVHGAELEAAVFVLVRAQSRDEDDGDVAGLRVGLEPFDDRVSIEARHHDIEQDEVRERRTRGDL